MSSIPVYFLWSIRRLNRMMSPPNRPSQICGFPPSSPPFFFLFGISFAPCLGYFLGVENSFASDVHFLLQASGMTSRRKKSLFAPFPSPRKEQVAIGIPFPRPPTFLLTFFFSPPHTLPRFFFAFL